MKVKETALNPTKQFEEVISGNPAVTSALSRQYLESVRGHYLSALAGLNIGKPEQPKIFPSVDTFTASDGYDLEEVEAAEQASIQGQLDQQQAFTEMDMHIHLSNGPFAASEKRLQSIKVHLSKTLGNNNEDPIAEMVSTTGDSGQDVELDAPELEAYSTVLSEPGGPKESLLKGVTEGCSLKRVVKSLKAKLENLKKEHAELKDKGAGVEFAARNLHFKLLKSKFEVVGCPVNEAKARQTLEEAFERQEEVEDVKIKGKGLKREHEASNISVPGEKKSRVAHGVQEAKENKVSSLVRDKSLSGRIYPTCMSTSEPNVRMLIPEDELEASSLKQDKSDKLERGKLAAITGQAEPDNFDNASEFSIRDYVFAARNKDISLNWPFSQKNLQLCLNCGVKEVLPPFQAVDSLRDSSMKRFVVETSCNSEESNLENRPLLVKNHLVTGATMDQQWNPELAEAYRDSDSFPSGGEKDLAFKTTATVNSEVESVSTSNLPLSEVSDERVAAASAVNDKTKSSASQVSDKKCQVTVKMRITTCRSAAEDITSACTVPLEAMTSKICPVCETFSSSSNTTLNAHIDQCLSSQSTPNWAKNSKLNKPRVKPRKIRLMSDICATAPRCTLEDLDRRNGSNWATTADCPSQEAEVVTDGKSHRVSSRSVANTGNDGAVYIDSSGRKIRILSKFDDTSSLSMPKGKEDLQPKKQMKKGKTSKFLSSTRKRRIAKHLKYLKINRQKQRRAILKVKGHSNKGFGPEETTSLRGDQLAGEQELAQFAELQEHEHAGGSGSSNLWISSKGSALSKKNGSQDINRPCRYELRATKDRQALKGPSGKGRIHMKKYSGSLRNCVSAQQSNLTIPGSCGPETEKTNEGSCRERTLVGPTMRGAIQGNRESYLVPSKIGAAQCNGEKSKEALPKCLDSRVTPSSSLDGELDIQADAAENVNSLFPNSRRLYDSYHGDHGGPLQGLRSQNSKTKALSPAHAHQSNSNRLYSPSEKSFGCRSNDKGDLWSSDRSQQSGAVPDHLKSSTSIDSLGHFSMKKVQKRRGLGVADDLPRDNQKTNGLLDRNCGTDGLIRPSIIGLHDNGEVLPLISSSGLEAGGTVVSLSNSSGPELQKIVNVQDPKSDTLQCRDKFQVSLFRTEASVPPDEPGLSNDHDMLYRNMVGDERLQFETGNSDLNVGRENSFPEVDPIPIPGPPGSDLPSFSDMGSEDLHRNSSLSGSFAQCSGDGDYAVDGDLSDSHLSATSTISNMGIKDDPNVSESVTITLPVSDCVYPGWSGPSSETTVRTSAPMFSQFNVAGTERFTSPVDNSNESVTAQSRVSPTLKNDSQHCSCSRKEGIPWSSALNFGEPQLVGPRMGTMVTVPSGKNTGSILSRRANYPDSRTVMLPSCARGGESENLAYPIEKPHRDVTPVEVNTEARVSFPKASDCDSVSPSAPILRLMGKDLMVINKEKDELSRDRTPQNASTNSQVVPVSELSSAFPSWHQSQHQSSRGVVFMAPTVLEQGPRTFAMRHFDFGSSNTTNNSKSPNQASGGMYVNKHIPASFSFPSSSQLKR